MYNYATGNRVGTIHFVWRIPEDISEEALAAGNSSALHKIEPSLPVFHTRAMRKQFFEEMKEGGHGPEPLANGYGFTGCDFVV